MTPASPSRVLVLGHGGFLGRHLCAALAAAYPRARLYGASRGAPGADGVQVRACDLRDGRRLKALLAAVRPDWVFHAAGSPAQADPDAMIAGQLLLTASLLKAASALARPPRIVLPGSAGEYGRVPRRELPVTEHILPRPVSPYGAVKLAQTALAQAAARAGADVVVARIFNVIGAGSPHHLALASFARQLAEAEAGLKAPVLETGDLSPKRDFVDVSDVAAGLLLLARRGRSGEVYNLSSGRSVSIAFALRVLIRLSGLRVRLRRAPGRLRRVDVPDIRGSFAKASRLGWRPRVGLERSLREMLDAERRGLRR